MASTRAEHLERAGHAFALGLERANELIDAGHAEQAAREAGCRTPAEISAWVARFAPETTTATASAAS